MDKKISVALVAVLVGLISFAHGSSQEPFYRGKTIRIIVGFSAGGGYDTYSRVIARHLGKHIPGNPSIIVQNMTGAGSLIAANHVAMVAKPDGLTVGHFIGGLFLQQLLGRPGIEFDARKLEYLGVPVQDSTIFLLSKASGVTSIEKWLASKVTVKLGGVGPGSATEDIPRVLQATIGLPLQIVSGYKGVPEIRLAVKGGEVSAVAGAWETFKLQWRGELEAGEVGVILQTIPKPHPELPRVPLAIDFAKSDEARKLIEVGVHAYGATARPYVLPPGSPKERVHALRKAFMDTMNNSEFLAEAKQARLEINPLSGEELERIVGSLFTLDPPLIAKLKEILK